LNPHSLNGRGILSPEDDAVNHVKSSDSPSVVANVFPSSDPEAIELLRIWTELNNDQRSELIAAARALEFKSIG
jgi:hypothetical protein